MLALRFVAAAGETDDAACFDAAFAEAEAAFGPRAGALVVARCVALLRAADRAGTTIALLPPACRSLSRAEAELLACLDGRVRPTAAAAPEVAAAKRDLAAALDAADPDTLGIADWTRSQLAAWQFPSVLS